MSNVTFPSVHLNGTSGADLACQHIEACGALRSCIEILNAAAPNARDYYPQGQEAYTSARAEHAHRIGLLEASLREHQAILDNIQEQLDARRAQKAGRR